MSQGKRAVSNYNLVLISIDTLRADHLSCYGYPKKTSPTIDALAGEGALFTNIMAQRSVTWPSLTSIMTSLYPVEHGVRDNGIQLNGSKSSLAQILKKKGYTCAAFLTAVYRAKWEGFDCKKGGHDHEVTAQAIEWLKSYHDKKLFLWIHYFAPHKPYEPSMPYKNLFDPRYKGNMDGSTKQLDEIALKKIKLSKEDLNHIISLYDGEIAFVDDQITHLINAIRKFNIKDKTLIVIVSDHGEDLYQHNFYFYHAASIYESSLRIPLIFNLPRVIPGGIKINKLVESIDIAPTILEILGISSPRSFRGTSLAPLFKNRDISLDEAYSEWNDKMLSVRTADYRYIYNPENFHPPIFIDDGDYNTYVIEQEELYDIKNDPLESYNIAKIKPKIALILRNKTLDWKKKHSWQINELKNKDYKIGKELKEYLKSLGYIN
jgi:arylsulfatase A-like enzyme